MPTARTVATPSISRVPSVISTGVDYLRVTCKSVADQRVLSSLYKTLGVALSGAGHEEQPWSFKGYIGGKIGGVAFGTRDDGGCLQVSGSMAQLAFSALPVGVGRCTRLDLQVTYDMGYDRESEAQRQNNFVLDHFLFANSKVKCRPYMYVGNGKGDSTYVGAPTSQAYARIYDKGREKPSEHQIGEWRYEIECKYETAQLAREKLQEAAEPGRKILGMVHSWLSDRGAVLPFSSNEKVPLPTFKAPPTSVEKKLAWLRKSVRGSVQYLIERGYEQEAVDALFWTDGHNEGELDDQPE